MATVTCGAATFTGIEAIFFDKDGTLANSHDYLRQLAQRRARLVDAQVPGVQEPLLMAFGVTDSGLDPAGLMAVGSRWENEVAAAAYVAETGKDWVSACTLIRQAFAEADTFGESSRTAVIPLFDGVSAVIDRLVAAELTLGLLSADSQKNVEDFLRHYQVASVFPVQQGNGGPGPQKPDPDFLRQGCDRIGLRPEQVVMIGDTTADIQMAQQAGAKAVGVTWGGTDPQQLATADAVIDNWSQLQVR